MVSQGGPLTGEYIAEQLGVTRAALRSDFAILVMSGILAARPKVGYYFTGKNNLAMMIGELADIFVRDVQSVPVVVESHVSAYEAVVKMFLDDVGSIYVVDKQGNLSGVVSRKDLLKAAINNKDLKDLPVIMVMTPLSKLIVTYPEENIVLAIRKIIDNEIDGLPVVNKQLDAVGYHVVGRLTKTNLTRILLELTDKKGGYYHS